MSHILMGLYGPLQGLIYFYECMQRQQRCICHNMFARSLRQNLVLVYQELVKPYLQHISQFKKIPGTVICERLSKSQVHCAAERIGETEKNIG